MILKLANNSVANPQTVDISSFVDVQDGAGFDIADGAFSSRIWSHSLLKPGATLALEQNVEREITVPLKIGPTGATGAPTTLAQTNQVIAQINQIIQTPGATLTWQADLASQPTIYDALSGQIDVDYRFRAEQQRWTMAKLRFFAQPFGRTTGPRPYAAASGVGPLLVISPYASGGGQIITASATGYGASPGLGPMGASSGVSYWGSPSLAGDAPAQLQISYVGPLPNTATNTGCVPYVAVSLLPDQYYQPLVSVPDIGRTGGSVINASGTVASQYLTVGASHGVGFAFSTLTFTALHGGSAGVEPIAARAGSHRLLAIARASGTAGCLQPLQNTLTSVTSAATVYPGADWGLYDLGTFSLRASEPPQQQLEVLLLNGPQNGVATTSALDLTAFGMLPDNSTWFLNPNTIAGSQYGYAAAQANFGAAAQAPYTNTLLIEDVLGDQFVYSGQSQTSAPSPSGIVNSSARITQYSRGLVPQPDPKNGLPIIAILGVGQNSVASMPLALPAGITANGYGASWVNSQSLGTMAQVSVVERARYVLP